MLTKEIEKLFSKQKLLHFEELLYDYESFEEIPLISRYSQINPLLKYIDRKDLNSLLFNIAFSYLNTTQLYAKNYLNRENINNFFICITYTDSWDEVEENGFYIPNFYVTQKKEKLDFLNKLHVVKLEKYPIIFDTLKQLNLMNSFIILYDKWFDDISEEYLQRFYFICNSDIEKLASTSKPPPTTTTGAANSSNRTNTAD